MKKKLIALGIAAVMVIGTGCTEQTNARNFGGEYTLELPAGKKLVNATWKEDTLWYLTRDMKQGETPEKYEFKADTPWGVFEGIVHIVESSK